MPILRQLHWLPVRQQVQFKIDVLVFQCLSGSAPTYLADDVSSSLTSARADSARPTQRYVLFDVHRTPSAIGVCNGLTTPVELVALQITTMRHSWTVQTVAEDTPVPEPRHFVTFFVKNGV